MWKVYGILDPRDGRIRYVGCTKQRWLSNRLANHLNSARLPTQKGYESKRSSWLREILGAGLRPTIALLVTADTKEEGLRIEKEWIEKFGYEQLVNINPKTVVRGFVRTPGYLEKQSEAQKRRWAGLPPETREEKTKRVAELGRRTGAAAAAIAHELRRGVPLSEDTKQKLRDARLGKKHTSEQAAAHKASYTPEVRERMRQAQLGRKQSDARREITRQALARPEVREKMRESAKKRAARQRDENGKYR